MAKARPLLNNNVLLSKVWKEVYKKREIMSHSICFRYLVCYYYCNHCMKIVILQSKTVSQWIKMRDHVFMLRPEFIASNQFYYVYSINTIYRKSSSYFISPIKFTKIEYLESASTCMKNCNLTSLHFSFCYFYLYCRNSIFNFHFRTQISLQVI